MGHDLHVMALANAFVTPAQDCGDPLKVLRIALSVFTRGEMSSRACSADL